MSSVQSGRTDDTSTRVLLAGGTAEFAGIMLVVVAVLEALQGIAAIANDTVFVRGPNYTYAFDITAWGWIHLSLGVVGVAIGIAIVAGNTVGYLGGIAVAFLISVAAFAFLPYSPWWSLLIIAFNVLVIWALCTQLGRDRVGDDGEPQGSTTDPASTLQEPTSSPASSVSR
jgi:hypothetical protein